MDNPRETRRRTSAASPTSRSSGRGRRARRRSAGRSWAAASTRGTRRSDETSSSAGSRTAARSRTSAAAARTFHRRIAATPRPRIVRGKRVTRSRDADLPRRRAAAAPRGCRVDSPPQVQPLAHDPGTRGGGALRRLPRRRLARLRLRRRAARFAGEGGHRPAAHVRPRPRGLPEFPLRERRRAVPRRRDAQLPRRGPPPRHSAKRRRFDERDVRFGRADISPTNRVGAAAATRIFRGRRDERRDVDIRSRPARASGTERPPAGARSSSWSGSASTTASASASTTRATCGGASARTCRWTRISGVLASRDATARRTPGGRRTRDRS